MPLYASTIEWVAIGDAGNFGGPQIDTASGPETLGAVDYEYRIGKYEVTNAQYVEFLNAKDRNGANSLSLYSASMTSQASGGINFDSGAAAGSMYSVKAGSANHPVNYVNWYDAARFANWLNNGQGSGDTESGAYTLLGGTATPTDTKSIVRNPGALIALPSWDEWYKAAYYDPTLPGGPGYWLYPTMSNSIPTSIAPAGPTNSANIRGDGFALTPGVGTGGVDVLPTVDYLTDVGAYATSGSYYGTFDQAGNVTEWTEELRMPANPSAVRAVLGGAFYNEESFSSSLGFAAATATGGGVGQGFRLVNLQLVPEPGGITLAALAGVALIVARWRYRKSLIRLT